MPTGCEVLFDHEQAEAMQDLIERATGKPCPCKSGAVCPLLPARGAVEMPMPRVPARLGEMVALLAIAFALLRL